MSATVICVEPFVSADGELRVSLRIDEPKNVPESGLSHELPCNPQAPPFADLACRVPGEAFDSDLVRVAGEQVFKSLSVHPGVLQALNRAVNTANGGANPIYFRTGAVDAEALPWELLHYPKRGFLVLDRRWPIARITGWAQNDARIHRLYKPPLRIAVILAAADRDATPEWDALSATLDASPLRASARAFVAQASLKDRIESRASENVSVQFVPGDTEQLMNELLDFEPHLVHVFAHGSVDVPGYLEVATRNTMDLGGPPLYLATRDLTRLRDIVWLITLNTCEGAAPSGESHSFAYALVQDGVPAAIGMRESIASTDAHVFCRAFFGEALAQIDAWSRSGRGTLVEWAAALRVPRNALCAEHPGRPDAVAGRHKEWTLPVLYCRPEPLIVEQLPDNSPLARNDSERLFAKWQTLRELRDRLHPDTPTSRRRRLGDEIDSVESTLFEPTVPERPQS